jgi:repressor LexA
MNGLTQKQRNILNFIHDFIELHGYSPSYKEIMIHFSFASTGSVHRHIQTLKRKGVLTAEKRCGRSVRPFENEIKEHPSNEVTLPLVGTVSAETAIKMFASPQTFIAPKILVPSPNETYILRILGDAFRGEMIADGDLILIEARQELQHGELIVGVVDGRHAFIKQHRSEEAFLDLPRNSLGAAFGQAPNLTIHGVIVGLIRAY